MGLFKRITLVGTLLLAMLGVGCSTTKPQPTREERLYQNLDTVNDLGYINAGSKLKRREAQRTANMMKDVDSYVDEKTRGEAKGVSELRKLNQQIKELEKSALGKSDDLIKEYKGLAEDYSKEMSQIFGDIDPRYNDENFRKDTERTSNLFGISPFVGLISQNKDLDSRTEIDDTMSIYGLKISKDFGKLSPYFLWEQGSTRNIEKDGSTFHSDIDSTMTTVGLGLDYKLFDGPIFDVDVGGYLAKTTELIDGDVTLNGTDYSVRSKDSFTGLGYDLGLSWGNDNAKFKLSAGGVNYPGWLNDSDAQNSRGLIKYTAGAEFNF